MEVCIHLKMRKGEFGMLKKVQKKLYKAIKVKGGALLALPGREEK